MTAEAPRLLSEIMAENAVLMADFTAMVEPSATISPEGPEQRMHELRETATHATIAFLQHPPIAERIFTWSNDPAIIYGLVTIVENTTYLNSPHIILTQHNKNKSPIVLLLARGETDSPRELSQNIESMINTSGQKYQLNLPKWHSSGYGSNAWRIERPLTPEDLGNNPDLFERFMKGVNAVLRQTKERLVQTMQQKADEAKITSAMESFETAIQSMLHVVNELNQ